MISRTALVTTASIAAVVLAGSFAMGANLGLFDRVEDPSGVGQLQLAEVQAAPTTPGATGGTSAMEQWSTQDYDVDGAGIVSLRWRSGTLEVARAEAATGWNAVVEPSASPDTAAAAFTSTTGSVYRFSAQLHADGSVQAAVDAQSSRSGGAEGEYEGRGEEEGEEHEDREHEAEEHEAEEHEYEGGEDDD
jgi:hypothetical protein